MPSSLSLLCRAVVLLALLTLVLSTASPSWQGRPPAPLVAAQAGTCVVGTELLRNGGFEEPVREDGTTVPPIVPSDWYGHPVSVRNALDGHSTAPEGDQDLDFLYYPLSQDLLTAGLDGATLLVTFVAFVVGYMTVDVGPTSTMFPATTGGAPQNLSTSVTLSDPAPATTVFTIQGGGGSVDAMSVMVSGCPDAGPVITLTGGVQDGGRYLGPSSVPPVPTCTAVDAEDGPVPCASSGYSKQIGRHTITFTADDSDGNTTTRTVRYYVGPGGSLPTAISRSTVPPVTPTATPRVQIRTTRTVPPISNLPTIGPIVQFPRSTATATPTRVPSATATTAPITGLTGTRPYPPARRDS